MLIKQTKDIAAIRKACAISSQLHLLAMSARVDNLSEKDLQDKINDLFKRTEAKTWAYPTIIGAGERSTILHAKPTKRVLKNNELVLIDMGVKYQNFASDITRTWPVGVKFTKEQKIIYKIVLKAQKEVIKRIKPNQTLTELHQICRDYLLEGLLSHKVIKRNQLNKVFPHRTSHWIGRLVHDDCAYFYEDKSPVKLSAGMVFTVEPGLYFKNISSKFDDIGIRIEDVVLVTDTSCEVLSHVPKEIEEIEMIRQMTLS